MPFEPIDPLGGFVAGPELPRPFETTKASPFSDDVAMALIIGLGFTVLKMMTSHRAALTAGIQRRNLGGVAVGVILIAVWYCALAGAGLWLLRYLT